MNRTAAMPFFEGKVIAGGYCPYCKERTPVDFADSAQTDEELMGRLADWSEQHHCKPVGTEYLKYERPKY